MKRYIKLPNPILSQLKEVNIDLEMTGRHFALLAACEGQLPEDVALSILKDLMDEDANKLTMSELRYLFMMVKINSLENKLTATVICNNEKEEKKDGKFIKRICGCENTFQVLLSDAEIKDVPEDFKIPTTMFTIDGVEEEYQLLPPTMDVESAIYDYFLTHKDAKQEDILNNKELSFQYTYLRIVAHLVDKNGQRVINKDTNFNDCFKWLDSNKFSVINKLFDVLIELGKYGVQNKVYEKKCKECGGSLTFQLPSLLYGLAN